jgi:hypothetical protein
MRKAGLGLLILQVVVSLSAGAQSVSLGSTQVTLGSAAEGALASLAREFKLQRLPGDETYLLRGKSGPPYGSYGTITVGNDRVTTINKFWLPVGAKDATMFARTLIAATASVIGPGGSESCVVSTMNSSEPEHEHRELRMQCRRRTLLVSYGVESSALNQGEDASITEVIQVE